jgi:sugar lactone lactonase YvrE
MRLLTFPMIAVLLRAIAATLPLSVARAVTGAVVPRSDIILLPGATSAEGITNGAGSTFYAGDVFLGNIYRGDLVHRTAELWIEAPKGRIALGMFTDFRHGRLFVAGGTGFAYVYDIQTGETVAVYELGIPNDQTRTLVNDVIVTENGAWFTDSSRAVLYFVPISPAGELGEASELPVTGPAAAISGEFNLNGIVAANGDKTLILAHTSNGKLYTVDPTTGASRTIEGVDVPRVDGLVLEGEQRLWAVQNFVNQISRIRLSHDLTSGTVENVITHEAFQVPATGISFGDHLAVVNAKFDTGVPPTADKYEVVLVPKYK